MSGTAGAPLLNPQDPETHLVLKILRLQVLTPLAVLINIATFLICGLVISERHPLPRPIQSALTFMLIRSELERAVESIPDSRHAKCGDAVTAVDDNVRAADFLLHDARHWEKI